MNPEATQQNAGLTPDAFKALIVQKYPQGKASDGTLYSQMDATDLTNRIVQKYPNGITNDGHKYSDYLPKQANTPSAQPQGLGDQVLGGVGSFLKGATEPVGTLLARPYQAISSIINPNQTDKQLANVPGLSNIYGDIPVPRTGGDLLKDVGRGAETVALGLNPVAGGVLYGTGAGVERGDSPLGVSAQGLVGGIGGKILDVAAPLLGKLGGKVTPQIIKDIGSKISDFVSPLTDKLSNFAENTKIMPQSVSDLVEKGTTLANDVPSRLGGLIKSQYGGSIGGSSVDALQSQAQSDISKALGNTGRKSAGVFAGNDAKRLSGLETLYDEAPGIKVNDVNGQQIPYDPKTATLNEQVQALDQAKKNIYQQLQGNINSATQGGIKVDTSETIAHLQSIAGDVGRSSAARQAAKGLISDISKLESPAQVNSYLQDLNTGLSGIANGSSQNIARKVEFEATQHLNDALDNTMLDTSNDSQPIRTLKDKYASLKSIENGLVSKAQQVARKTSGGLGGGISDYINAFNLADALDIIGNPMGAVKAGVRAGLLNKMGGLKDSEQLLQGVFQKIGTYRNFQNGIKMPSPSALPGLIKNTVNAGSSKVIFGQ